MNNCLLQYVNEIESQFSREAWDTKTVNKHEFPNIWSYFYSSNSVTYILDKYNLSVKDFEFLHEMAYEIINQFGYNQLSSFDSKASYDDVLIFFKIMKQKIKLLAFQ